MRIVLLGPPGSGKGTLAAMISEAQQIQHISTGDLFRKNIRENTELGKKVKAYVDKGDLVPDELTVQMLGDYIHEVDTGAGFLLDGFPRTLHQAHALDELLKKDNHPVELAINVSVPDDVIMKRLTGRRVCPQCGTTYNVYSQPSEIEGTCDHCKTALIQREDDKEETIRKRLKTYAEKTAPLIQFYEAKGLLKTVDNSGTFDEAWNQLKEVLTQ